MINIFYVLGCYPICYPIKQKCPQNRRPLYHFGHLGGVAIAKARIGQFGKHRNACVQNWANVKTLPPKMSLNYRALRCALNGFLTCLEIIAP